MKFHVRRHEVASVEEARDLIERFIEDKLKHGFEWADFIEWDNKNKDVEKIRKNIDSLTPILLSSKPNRIERYRSELAIILNNIEF